MNVIQLYLDAEVGSQIEIATPDLTRLEEYFSQHRLAEGIDYKFDGRAVVKLKFVPLS